MKTLTYSFITALILCAHLLSHGQEVISMDSKVRYLSVTSNDNRDPNWDWTQNSLYTLETTSGTYNSIRLPYYNPEGPAYTFFTTNPKDIYKSDGWELILRDFGPGIVLPYFILYNKYKGIFRVFYWSTLPQGFSKGVGKLSFAEKNLSAAHFALSVENETLENFKTGKSQIAQIATGSISWHQWNMLDFDMSGYDPAAAGLADATLILEISGTTQTDLTIKGEIDFSGSNANTKKDNNATVDGFNNVVQNSVKGFSSITGNYDKMSKAKAKFAEMAADNSSKWWASFVQGIGTLGDQSWLPALGAVAGVVDFALGFGSKSTAASYPKGIVELTGQLVTSTQVYQKQIRLPGSIHTDPSNDALSNILPLYDKPLGVFNLASLPQCNVYAEYRGPDYDPEGRNIIRIRSLSPVYNPHVFSDITLKASHLSETSSNANYQNMANFMDAIWYGPWDWVVHYSWIVNNLNYIRDNHLIGLYVELQPIDNSQKVQLIKGFDPGYALKYGDITSQANYAALPYFENFESTSSYWDYLPGAPNGVRRMSSPYSYSGNFLAMDIGNNSSGPYVLNRAQLNVDLLGNNQDKILSFKHREFSEETHPEDGIFLSVDGGSVFYKVFDLGNRSSTWTTYTINLSSYARENNLVLSPSSVIRIQQYDNYAISTDGIGIDNLSIDGGSYPAAWKDVVNCTVNGNTVTKTSSTNWNAGIATTNEIPANQNGWVQWEVNSTNVDVMFGLSYTNTDASWNTIDFNLYVSKYRGNKIVIYSRNSELYTYSGTYALGDLVKVERVGSTVYFKLNDQTIYTRSCDGSRSMIGDGALYNQNAQLFNVQSSHPVSGAGGRVVNNLELGSYTMHDDFPTDTLSLSANLVFFPNPVTDVLNIRGDHNFDQLELVILDINGSIIDQKKWEGSQNSSLLFNARSLQPGVYIGLIKNAHGVQVKRFKFIKR